MDILCKTLQSSEYISWILVKLKKFLSIKKIWLKIFKQFQWNNWKYYESNEKVFEEF